jgi:hypothetical protein
MAKVYGQDIPSKHYDTYHNFFAHSYDQSHQPYGKSVKKSNWDFPGYPYHPKFPSPAQLYVRAVFKSATECWHLQPDTGDPERPPYGPIPKPWWSAEAAKDRTFGYRKFMRDTLLQKFRVGDPDWCMPSPIEMTYVDADFPDDNYCTSKNVIASQFWLNRWRNIYVWRPPWDIGKDFFHIHAYNVVLHPELRTCADIVVLNYFAETACEITYNTQPTEYYHLSRIWDIGTGWFRFYVADMNVFKIRIYFTPFWEASPVDKGAMFCNSSLADEIELRPFFST